MVCPCFSRNPRFPETSSKSRDTNALQAKSRAEGSSPSRRAVRPRFKTLQDEELHFFSSSRVVRIFRISENRGFREKSCWFVHVFHETQATESAFLTGSKSNRPNPLQPKPSQTRKPPSSKTPKTPKPKWVRVTHHSGSIPQTSVTKDAAGRAGFPRTLNPCVL